MSTATIRPAYSNWPWFNQRLREVVAILTDAQLAIRPSPERWPLWATVGHVACQRVSWLCGVAGEPGAEATPFPDALHRCPGDGYLEPVLNGGELVVAVDASFRIVEHVLDIRTLDMLDQEIRRRFGGAPWACTRGWVIQRVFAHDIYHAAELNETLARNGLPLIELWI